MHFAYSTEVYLPGKRLLGLPDDRVLIALMRLRHHKHCMFCAVITQKKFLLAACPPRELPDADIILFINENRVMSVEPTDSCRLHVEGGGTATFDRGRIPVVFGPHGGSYCAEDIEAEDVLFSI